MYDEFVAFEKMVATKDFDSVAQQLEHSRQVMEVLDQASKALWHTKKQAVVLAIACSVLYSCWEWNLNQFVSVYCSKFVHQNDIFVDFSFEEEFTDNF